MAVFPCANYLDCGELVDAPVLNLSAEQADPRKFFKRSFGLDSSTFCTSTISQADADLCDPPPVGTFNVQQNGPAFSSGAAAGGTIGYQIPSGSTLGLDQESADQAAQQIADNMLEILNNLEIFTSQAQACENCEGGQYIAPAGTAYGLSQAEANAAALAFACLVSTAICNEESTDLFFSAAQSCSVGCANGGAVTYTLNAGLFAGLSQEAANASAFGFACAVANYLCSIAILYPSSAQSCTVSCSGGGTRSFSLPAGAFQATTQAESDFLSNVLACSIASITCDQPQVPTGTDPSDIQVYFGNSAQTCSTPCPQGGAFTLSTPASQFYRTSIDAANAAAQSYACNQATLNRVCLGNIALTCCVGVAFADLILVTPDSAVTWSLTGSLPAGLAFDAGLITGVPTTPGDYSFTVRATLANGNYVSRGYSIRALEITTSALPGGIKTDPVTPYSAALTQVGGDAPVTWSLVSGSLPPGLSLSSSGTISGGPTNEGSYGFTVRFVDANGFTCSKALSITIAEETGTLDWSLLSWVPLFEPDFLQPAPAAGSSAVGTFSMANFNGLSVTAGDPVMPPSGFYDSIAAGLGTLTYTGPAQDCLLDISFTVDHSGGATNAYILVQVRVNGVMVFNGFSDSSGGDSGTVPFSVPASVGALVEVEVQCACHNQDFGHSQVQPSAQLSGFLYNAP